MPIDCANSLLTVQLSYKPSGSKSLRKHIIELLHKFRMHLCFVSMNTRFDRDTVDVTTAMHQLNHLHSIYAVHVCFAGSSSARGLWVVPNWAAGPDADAFNVMLTPGVAFGAGDHPTTALCLRWLHRRQEVLQVPTHRAA